MRKFLAGMMTFLMIVSSVSVEGFAAEPANYDADTDVVIEETVENEEIEEDEVIPNEESGDESITEEENVSENEVAEDEADSEITDDFIEDDDEVISEGEEEFVEPEDAVTEEEIVPEEIEEESANTEEIIPEGDEELLGDPEENMYTVDLVVNGVAVDSEIPSIEDAIELIGKDGQPGDTYVCEFYINPTTEDYLNIDVNLPDCVESATFIESDNNQNTTFINIVSAPLCDITVNCADVTVGNGILTATAYEFDEINVIDGRINLYADAEINTLKISCENESRYTEVYFDLGDEISIGSLVMGEGSEYGNAYLQFNPEIIYDGEEIIEYKYNPVKVNSISWTTATHNLYFDIFGVAEEDIEFGIAYMTIAGGWDATAAVYSFTNWEIHRAGTFMSGDKVSLMTEYFAPYNYSVSYDGNKSFFTTVTQAVSFIDKLESAKTEHSTVYTIALESYLGDDDWVYVSVRDLPLTCGGLSLYSKVENTGIYVSLYSDPEERKIEYPIYFMKSKYAGVEGNKNISYSEVRLFDDVEFFEAGYYSKIDKLNIGRTEVSFSNMSNLNCKEMTISSDTIFRYWGCYNNTIGETEFGKFAVDKLVSPNGELRICANTDSEGWSSLPENTELGEAKSGLKKVIAIDSDYFDYVPSLKNGKIVLVPNTKEDSLFSVKYDKGTKKFASYDEAYNWMNSQTKAYSYTITPLEAPDFMEINAIPAKAKKVTFDFSKATYWQEYSPSWYFNDIDTDTPLYFIDGEDLKGVYVEFFGKTSLSTLSLSSYPCGVTFNGVTDIKSLIIKDAPYLYTYNTLTVENAEFSASDEEAMCSFACNLQTDEEDNQYQGIISFNHAKVGSNAKICVTGCGFDELECKYFEVKETDKPDNFISLGYMVDGYNIPVSIQKDEKSVSFIANADDAFFYVIDGEQYKTLDDVTAAVKNRDNITVELCYGAPLSQEFFDSLGNGVTLTTYDKDAYTYQNYNDAVDVDLNAKDITFDRMIINIKSIAGDDGTVTVKNYSTIAIAACDIEKVVLDNSCLYFDDYVEGTQFKIDTIEVNDNYSEIQYFGYGEFEPDITINTVKGSQPLNLCYCWVMDMEWGDSEWREFPENTPILSTNSAADKFVFGYASEDMVPEIKEGKLYAKAGENYYSISYNAMGGSVPQDAPTRYGTTNGAVIPEPFNDGKLGYFFDGWYTSPSFTAKSYIGWGIEPGTKGNLTLYAKWIPATYTIRFAKDSADVKGTMKDRTVSFGSEEKIPANTLKRPGYAFVGWSLYPDDTEVMYTDKQVVMNLIEPTEESLYNTPSITLHPVWRKEFRVVFHSAFDNGKPPVLDEKTVIGAGFFGYANADLCTYTNYEYGKQIKLPTPIRPGFKFEGWYDSQTGKKITKIAKNSTTDYYLFAHWTEIKYTLKFDGNGAIAGKVPSVNALCATNALLPECDFVKPGYRFKGWALSKDSEKVYSAGYNFKASNEAEKVPTKNKASLTLYAIWEEDSESGKYEITVYRYPDLKNKGVGTATYEYGVKPEIITITPMRDGFEFKGWYFDEEFTTKAVFNEKTYGDKELYAKWDAKYTIVFHDDGQTGTAAMKSIEANFAKPVKLPKCTYVKEGYSFAGWKYTPAASSETLPPDSPFSVAFEDASKVSYPNGDNLKKEDGKLVLNLSPVWLNRYTASFYINGGNVISKEEFAAGGFSAGSENNGVVPCTYPIGETYTLPTPVRPGYAFKGWFFDEKFKTKAVFNEKTTGNKQIYAKWAPLTVKVVFNSNLPEGVKGKAATKTQKVTFGKETTLTANKFKAKGYTFVGWSFVPNAAPSFTVFENKNDIDGSEFLANYYKDGKFDTVNLYAVWELDYYYIDYYGVSESEADSFVNYYDVNSPTIELPTPVRIGYSFAGWYKDANFKKKASSIKAGSTGDVKLYAKWVRNKSRINW